MLYIFEKYEFEKTCSYLLIEIGSPKCEAVCFVISSINCTRLVWWIQFNAEELWFGSKTYLELE